MYELDASQYHSAITVLHQILAVPKERPDMAMAAMDQRAKAHARVAINKFLAALGPLQVPVTRETAIEIRDIEIADAEVRSYGEFSQLVLTLNSTLRRELKTAKCFVLASGRSEFYQQSEPLFGADVARKFPSIAYDIDQAGKCYALELNTASAFHSIRCMEAAIRAIARFLGIPDPMRGSDRNWSNVCRAISVEMERRWPKASGRMSGDGQTFDEIYGALSGMQNPYRNSTMHLNAKYDGPEALHIFHVVKGLMIKVASRIDEDGKVI